MEGNSAAENSSETEFFAIPSVPFSPRRPRMSPRRSLSTGPPAKFPHSGKRRRREYPVATGSYIKLGPSPRPGPAMDTRPLQVRLTLGERDQLSARIYAGDHRESMMPRRSAPFYSSQTPPPTWRRPGPAQPTATPRQIPHCQRTASCRPASSPAAISRIRRMENTSTDLARA